MVTCQKTSLRSIPGLAKQFCQIAPGHLEVATGVHNSFSSKSCQLRAFQPCLFWLLSSFIENILLNAGASVSRSISRSNKNQPIQQRREANSENFYGFFLTYFPFFSSSLNLPNRMCSHIIPANWGKLPLDDIIRGRS